MWSSARSGTRCTLDVCLKAVQEDAMRTRRLAKIGQTTHAGPNATKGPEHLVVELS